MNRRLFTDEFVVPTEALLHKQLGKGMEYYIRILSTSGDYRKRWCYSRGNGWILKVADARRALFYVIPLVDGIEISLTIRDSERAVFMKNGKNGSASTPLGSAVKYSEGYALLFGIGSIRECAAASKFLSKLMTMRAA